MGILSVLLFLFSLEFSRFFIGRVFGFLLFFDAFMHLHKRLSVCPSVRPSIRPSVTLVLKSVSRAEIDW